MSMANYSTIASEKIIAIKSNEVPEEESEWKAKVRCFELCCWL
jgi:hypothetical protein